MRGASAISWGMGVSLPPSILNLKTRGMPLGMPTRLISSSDKLSMYFTTPEVGRIGHDKAGQSRINKEKDKAGKSVRKRMKVMAVEEEETLEGCREGQEKLALIKFSTSVTHKAEHSKV